MDGAYGCPVSEAGLLLCAPQQRLGLWEMWHNILLHSVRSSDVRDTSVCVCAHGSKGAETVYASVQCSVQLHMLLPVSFAAGNAITEACLSHAGMWSYMLSICCWYASVSGAY